MKPKTYATMTNTLRQAIADSGLPMLTIATETGIERTSLIRFARGDQSLRLDIADRLAEYFGFWLTRQRKAKWWGPSAARRQLSRRRTPGTNEDTEEELNAAIPSNDRGDGV